MKTQYILSLLLFIALLARCDHPVTKLPSTELHTPSPTSTPVPPLTPTVEMRSQNLTEWAELSTDKGPVYSQAWSADGKILVTADYDQIRIWDAVTFREVGVLEGHTDFVWGLAWSPTSNPLMLASASQDGSVRLWNMVTFTQTDLLETGWAYCLAWSPNGRQLAVGNDAGDVQLWDVAAREILKTWSSDGTNARDDIISIAWSPDGQTVAFGDLAGNINLWDVATGQARMVLTEQTTDHARDVNGLAWSPDSALLASTHPDGQVQIWDRATGHMVQAIAAHTGWARGIAFSPDGRLLASTGEDKSICLWDVATGQKYAEQHHNSLPVWSVSWSPDSEYIASGGGEYEQPHVGTTIIWRFLTTPSPTDLPTEEPNETEHNVTVPENPQPLTRLYTLSDYAIVYNAFDIKNPTSSPIMFLNQTTGFSGPIPNTMDGWAPDLSPIDQRVVFIKHNNDHDWPMYVVNVDGSNLQQLTGNHLDHFPAWAPDGKRLVFSRDGNLWVMDDSTDAGSEINLVQLTSDPKEVVTAPRWSPDGQKIIYSSQLGNPLGTASYEDPNSVEIYIINADGSELTRLTQNTAVDGFADWSPDGTLLVFSSNRDGKFALYTMLPDGSEVKRLTELDSNNINPIWALDGRQIIFSSDRDEDEYTYQLYTMNADGSEIKRLSISDTSDFNPATNH